MSYYYSNTLLLGPSGWHGRGRRCAARRGSRPGCGSLRSIFVLIVRGGILRPRGDLPESLSQAMLVGVMLVGRLGVPDGNAAAHLIYPRCRETFKNDEPTVL